MKQIILSLIFSATISTSCFSQTKTEIFAYLKSRIEILEVQRNRTISLSKQNTFTFKYNSMSDREDFFTVQSFELTNVIDVFTSTTADTYQISIKLSRECNLVTDVKGNGKPKFLSLIDRFGFVFKKDVTDKATVEKIAKLFKKLCKMCGAKLIEI